MTEQWKERENLQGKNDKKERQNEKTDKRLTDKETNEYRDDNAKKTKQQQRKKD